MGRLKIWGIAALLALVLAPSATRSVDALPAPAVDRSEPATAKPMTVWVAAKKKRAGNTCKINFDYCVKQCAKDDFLCQQICSTDQWYCETFCPGVPC